MKTYFKPQGKNREHLNNACQRIPKIVIKEAVLQTHFCSSPPPEKEDAGVDYILQWWFEKTGQKTQGFTIEVANYERETYDRIDYARVSRPIKEEPDMKSSRAFCGLFLFTFSETITKEKSGEQLAILPILYPDNWIWINQNDYDKKNGK